MHPHAYLVGRNFRYSNRLALGVDDTLQSKLASKGVTEKRLIVRVSDSKNQGVVY